MSKVVLPSGFEDLLPWTGWSQARMDDRRDLRINSSMEDIETFYDAMLPRLGAALEHLASTEINGMDPRSATLMNMVLSLAEVAPAVEQFGEPGVSYGYDVTRFVQAPQ